jgi:type IV pilus assembly protein PilM
VAVTAAPTFKENTLAFGVCYGLCVQGLGKGRLGTSLLPRDIVVNRMIKEKKPWAAAAVGGLLLALAFHFFFVWNKWHTADKNRTDSSGTSWARAIEIAASVDQEAKRNQTEDKTRQDEFARLKGLQSALIGTGENRLLWLELMKAVNSGLPVDRDPSDPPNAAPDPNRISKKPIPTRRELHITRIESEYFDDLKTWFTEPVKRKFLEQTQGIKFEPAATSPANPMNPMVPANPVGPMNPMGPMPANPPPAVPAPAVPPPAAPPSAVPPPATPPAPGADPNAPTADPNAPPADAGPEGPGWVIEIEGYHLYQNDRPQIGGENFLRETILRHLHDGRIELPIPTADGTPSSGVWTMKELGIRYPVILDAPPIDRNNAVLNPDFQGEIAGGGPVGPGPAGPNPALAEKQIPREIFVAKQSFRIQFCWKETPVSKRIDARIAEQKKADEAAAANGAPGAAVATPPGAVVPVAGGN